MRRTRGNTMALYAAFILFVGVPLMALTWDIGRLKAATAKLASAAEAGCDAYANELDADTWITGGPRQFAPNAINSALAVFYRTAPPGSTLFITPIIIEGHPLQARCSAITYIKPYIDLGLGDYHAEVFADAKSDWVSNPFEK